MLTYLPPFTLPDTNALRNGTFISRDGHGYAIVIPETETSPARLLTARGLSAKDMIAQFAADRRRYPNGPALFHSRFGTSGTTDKFNVHPFPVGHDPLTVVAHNGILPDYMQPAKTDPRCDTQAAADDRFNFSYGHLSTHDARQRLAEAIGRNNKLVILTVNDDYSEYSYIINESSGVWDSGIWYSNSDYLPYTPRISVYTPTADELDDNDCPVCDSKNTVDLVSYTCTMCLSCMDCFESVSDCLCYPGVEDKSGLYLPATQEDYYKAINQ